jgi:NAD(P)-dependent dehydrogenase (short-subunit alcohol dehydrogenase family)
MTARVTALTTCALGAFLMLRRPVKYPLKDKVVVITGGSRGLGLALAREFARHQARPALLARDPDELERAARDVQGLGANVRTWACNVQDERDVAQTISAIEQGYGQIDVLVNNAGVMLVAPLEAMEKEDFERTWQFIFGGRTVSRWQRCRCSSALPRAGL